MASTAEHQAQPRDTTTSNDDIANITPEAGADVAMSSPAATADNDAAATSSTPPSAAAPAATAPPHGSSSSSSSSDAAAEDNTLSITLTHHGTPYTLALPASATLAHLSAAVATHLSIPPAHQKFLITPKPGLVKPPFRDPALPLAPLVAARRKIVLMGSTAAEVSSLQQRVSQAASQHAARTNRRYAVAAPATPARTAGRGVVGSARASEEVKYTFHALRPLAHLPRPERSLAFLERLRDDAGVRAAMRRHGFSVGLLTEMDPAMHTTHESRTLGLNRNRGEVIELRLRTDAYDGYRDYKTIRRTLCHELAHNVWGEHDRNFWNLCREIEGEVERADWRSGGRRVGGVAGDEVYEPPDDPEGRGDAFDHGGWTGGEFVLGGSGAAVVGSSGTVTAEAGEGLSRREVLARAAEERAKRARQGKSGGEGGEESR
ncbi:Ubiquitin and WLM domain-containing protein [Diplodia seriata]|uniref:Ubiquitin and WLM domain-containing protein n=1 Tax=Diplodia seriata TaxID=420778 RepID=A0A1S8BE52_9PEZI|nr:Ubiquitin and WLM domain-containing protein [Diplodia seriata]